MKIRKIILKTIYNSMLAVCLFSAGVLIGLYIAQMQAQVEAQKLTIDTIAVVNMDEGITADSGYINYASELISYPDLNFISTSLEEARMGVQTGSCAAYILIPAEFSASVVSLNTIPTDASLQYAINPDLRDDIYTSVMEDISAFTKNLNDNIEYMYLTSILSEFHLAQDSAQQIMINDTEDMNLLLDIGYDELENRITLSPVEMPDYDLSTLDLSPYYQSNGTLISDIAFLYASYESSGEQAFAGIMQSGAEVSAKLSGVRDLMEQADFSKDANGNDIMSAGIQNVDSYVAGVIAQNADTILRIETGISAYQFFVSQEMSKRIQEEIVEGLTQSVNQYNGDMLNSIMTEIEELQQIVGALQGIAGADFTNQGINANDPVSDVQIAGTGTAGELSDIQNRLDAVAAQIEAIRQNTFSIEEAEIGRITEQVISDTTASLQTIIDDMNSIQYMDTAELSSVINDSVLVPLQNNQSRIAGNVDAALSDVNAAMASYQDRVCSFNMYDYVNEDEIDGKIAQIQENMNTMQTAIHEQDTEYREFVYDIYTAENENLNNWRNEIQEADELSAQKLEQGLEAAKLSRSNSNSNNVELLYALTQKLPYTRMGSVEYINAYEFIVSPISTVNIGAKQNVTFFSSETEYAIYIVWVMAFMLGILFIRIGYYAFCRRREELDDHEEHRLHFNKIHSYRKDSIRKEVK